MSEQEQEPSSSAADQALARDVVGQLEQNGYQALWAGGCVRDRLLGKSPKDYDVATDATPEQVRTVFGRRRTLFIGAAFGVVSVLGRKGVQPVEVATFREDGGYSDGRRPDHVTFSNAEEDAKRRDFTINGLFFHPFEDRVIDYVGGEKDLQRGLVRCIGDPHERFEEDKLRMLRAVRFAATLEFEIDPDTRRAITARPTELLQVSAERIAAEMRRLLTHKGCVRGLQLLEQCGLRPIVLPEFGSSDATSQSAWNECLYLQQQRSTPYCFPTALAAIALALAQCTAAVQTLSEISKRWKLSNQERECAVWLVQNLESVARARDVDWADLQPILIHPEIERLLRFCCDMLRERQPDVLQHVSFCRQQLQRAEHELNPSPLVDGHDLMEAGIPAGRHLGLLLNSIRRQQLRGEITTKANAIKWATCKYESETK